MKLLRLVRLPISTSFGPLKRSFVVIWRLVTDLPCQNQLDPGKHHIQMLRSVGPPISKSLILHKRSFIDAPSIC